MDYEEIGQLMASKGLSSDPAFDDLTFLVEPTPSMNGCPLGLYYPESAVTVIPPDALASTVLHELGHRHGHYYHNDLSEIYAENFRRMYQRGKALLYVGSDFSALPRFAALFEEGERGMVEIALSQPLSLDELYNIRDQLYLYNSYGEPYPRVSQRHNSSPVLSVEFTTGVAWMVIIGAVVAGAVILSTTAIGYAVYKWTKQTPWIVPLGLFCFVGFLGMRALVRKAERYALEIGRVGG